MRFGRCFFAAVVVASVVVVGGALRAVEWSPLLELQLPAGAADQSREAVEDVGRDERMPYVAGIIGSSFDAAGGVANGRLPMGDAAIGVSIPRPAGALRLELEGRQRTALSDARVRGVTNDEAAVNEAAVNIDGEWTTLANVWRDVAVGQHAAVYAGAGAGVGGYRETVANGAADHGGRVTDFAWQVGGGATYAVTDRVTLDAGYRYYGVGADRQVEPAGEVVFAVRITDPFRGWLRR